MQNATRSFLPKSILGITLGLITSFTGYKAAAIDVVTDPVGFYKLPCQGNSDTIVSTPFTRIPEFTGLIGSIAANVITVSNTPGFTANQFVYLGVALQSNHYYAVVSSGTQEGKLFPITNNTASTLSVQLLPEDLTGVGAGDQIKIIPYWTLLTAFSDGTVNPSASAGTRLTELLIPNFNGTNTAQSPASTYYYFTNATVRAWRLQGGGTTSHNEDVLVPDGYSIVRQNVATLTTVIAPGAVPMKKQRTVVGRNGAGTAGRDNYIAEFRPAAVSLNDSTLFQSGAFRPSASAGTRVDELLVTDNNAAGQNKSPAFTYYYFTNATVSAWRLQGGGTTDRGTTQVFQPGFGVVLRANNIGNPVSPTAATWVNSPTY